ncbi:MAG: 3-hydroxyacyl-ACP dehydratase FabZ, partial [Nitrospinae bacterium]|nr:3-hydroxyacyl-ACP dehydratase FabZ [Nitrospinota bacterium]
KNVTINEPFFQGHFPGEPVMPGVLIIEAMAQVGGIMAITELGHSTPPTVFFMTIDDCKFRVPVVPGDSIHIKMSVLKTRKNIWSFKGEAYVEEKLVAQAELKAMVVEG